MQPCSVALVQIAGDGLDAGEEGLVSSREPTARRRWPGSPRSCRSAPVAPVDQARDVHRRVLRVSSSRTPSRRCRASSPLRRDPGRRRAVSRSRGPPTSPSPRRHRAIVRARRQTAPLGRRHACTRVPREPTARGDRAARLSARSSVRCGQSGSGHEKRRLDQTSRTRRLNAGKSLMTTRSRSFVLAITPQTGQPAARRIVSMPTSSSVAVLGHRQHPEARQSQQRVVEFSTVTHGRGPSSLVVVEQPREWRGPLPRRWIPIGARSDVHAPSSLRRAAIVSSTRPARAPRRSALVVTSECSGKYRGFTSNCMKPLTCTR